MKYDRKHPFLGSCVERYSLCEASSGKRTDHVVVSIAGSGIRYKVGDSIAVLARHDEELVERTLRVMQASGEELVGERRSGERVALREFLAARAEITQPTVKLFRTLAERAPKVFPEEWVELLKEERRPALKALLEELEVWDLLEAARGHEMELQEVCDLLTPLMPRFYSIASSQQVSGDEVHFTVALVDYMARGYRRYGVATRFLCDLAPMGEAAIPLYLHPSRGFTLPADEASIIMVGPGTGIAPFRGFMEERLARAATGRSWLFFGEWTRAHHYFYGDFWERLVEQGKLTLDLAFSREQLHKIYVQDRMLEKGQKLMRWLEEGAYLFVCGDATRMAKDVEAALLEIVERHGGKSQEEAHDYVKELRRQGRYLRDVY